MEKKQLASKNSIRSYYLIKRDKQTVEERINKSEQIICQLKESAWFKEATIILCYMDYRGEVITTTFIKELIEESNNRKSVFCPKVIGEEIEFYKITDLEQLEVGFKGIREPIPQDTRLFTEQIEKENKCLVVMPGAVFDKKRGRLGYGKGFYDRFLSRFSNIFAVGLAFDCQIAPEIPVEKHDMKPNIIITELEIIY